jgi:DNA (cytosine-5)-methyltransferase 1
MSSLRSKVLPPTKTGKDSSAPAGCLFPLEEKTPTPTASQLILSTFPGVGLLDRGFEGVGFTVVRGPDPLWGGDIRKFHIGQGWFDGIIGGPPCQKFSLANRNRDIEAGMILVNEFFRVVKQGQPRWWLMENVPGSPNCDGPAGYLVQRFSLDSSHVGSEQRRLRKFHFGYQPGLSPLVIIRQPAPSHVEPTLLATEGRRGKGRSWERVCELQGLPAGFDLAPFTVEAKKRAVGNGVPFPMALALAQAVKLAVARCVTPFKLCACGCGEPVHGKAFLATVACRQRYSRERRALRKLSPKQFGLVLQHEIPVTIPTVPVSVHNVEADMAAPDSTVTAPPPS